MGGIITPSGLAIKWQVLRLANLGQLLGSQNTRFEVFESNSKVQVFIPFVTGWRD